MKIIRSALYLTTVVLLLRLTEAADPVFTYPAPDGSTTLPIPEDTATGTSIATLAATDADSDPLTYSVSGTTLFNVVGTTLRTASTFDYESGTTSYSISISVTDSTATVSAVMVVTITDVNDNTPIFSPSVYSASIEEGSASGVSVAAVTCNDADSGTNGACTITIQSGDDGKFAVSGNTIQTSSNAIDYEALSSNNYIYSLVVIGYDNPGSGTAKTGTAYVYVTITGKNDNAPSITSTSPGAASIGENSAVGTTVFTVQASDADDGVDGQITYSIIAGNSEAKFAIESSTGEIYVVKALDRETTPSYTLTAKAEDGGTPSQSATSDVTVTITDVSDNAPSCSPTIVTQTVAETAASGSAVTTLACTDDDSGDTLAYSFASGNAAGCFAIASGSGAITTACALDYDAGTRDYTLIVSVTDSTVTTTVTVVVEVGASNEHTPTFATKPSQPIAEDTAVGTSIFQYTADDNDASPHGISEYAIFAVTNSGTGKFSIDSDSANIYLSQEVDYESQTSYELTITASDGTNVGTGTVTITVTDVNDNSPSCSPDVDTQTVSETATSGTAVTTVACSDADTGNTLAYSIASGNSDSCFAIGSSTGAITTACNTLDYDAGTRFYTLLISVTDSTTTTTATVVVEITAVNENTPNFASNPSYSIPENTAVGTSITQYTADDADASPHGIATYAITSVTNSGAGKFSIDSASGKIYLSQEMDYESQTSYKLTVTASDGTNIGTGTVTIAITDVNDNSPVCSPNVDTKTVLESAASGSAVTTLACSDADTADTLTYAIASGNSESCFAISSGTGAVTTACTLNYDSGTREYTLLVSVTDSSATTTATVVVEVGAVNQHTPNFASNPSTTLAEDAVVGTSIITYTAVDTDASPHDIISYTIQSVNNGGTGKFSVDQTSGKIQLSQEMDYEAQQSYELTVTAYDGTNTGTGTVTIAITDVNDNAPSCSPAAHVLSLAENTATNTKVISDLSCTDGDTGNTLAYTMTQNPGNKFSTSLTGTVASLEVSVALDYETTTFYQLKVTVTDDGAPALSTTVDVDVTITDVNEAPPAFSTGTYTVSKSEDTAVGSTIVTVTATDTDSGDSISYAFLTSYTGFLLDTVSGNVLLTQSLDRETAASHELQVTATDGSSTTTATVTITVTDVNEAPVFVSSTYTLTFAENQASGTSVVQVSANDQDSGTDGTITYTITDGDGTSYFAIDSSTGIITSSAVIDYEVNSFFYLVVRAADGASPSLSATCLVEITVSDENDNAPVFVPAVFAESLAEDSAIGTTVATLTAGDADSSSNNNNVFEYSSVSSVPFTVGVNTGIVTTNALLDRETTASYIMEVLATDKGTPAQTGTSTLTISLTDINDNNPIVSGTYDTTIDEDTAVNSVIFTITASDADANDNGRLTYTINSGNTNSDFKIESGTGIIQTVNSLDRETTASYSLVIYVADNGGTARTTSVTCTVTISDLNDNTPQWGSASYTFTVDENVATSTSVGTIAATDADTGVNSALTYSNLGYWQGGSNPFSVDGATGVITTSGSLDRETSDTYVIWCRVQDGGSPILSSDINVTITINDLNDNDPIFGSSLYTGTVVENSAVSTSILTVTATDADIGNNALLTYSIDTSTTEGTTGNTYLTVGSSTGIITVKANIDREVTSYFNITVIATDAGTSTRSGTTNVQITVSDENDNDPVLSPVFYNSEVPYSDSCSSTIATLTATDADTNENAALSYYLVTSDINFLFSLSSSTGALTLAGRLTTSSKYVLYAHARDSGSPERTTTTSATIRVDAYTAGDVMISFYMSIAKSTFTAAESTFLSQLDTVYQVSYSTAITRRWCISEVSSSSIIVHVYVLQDNVTNDVANIDSTKNYLTASTIHGFVAVDSAGTPSSKITGSSWTQFGITKVILYQESSSDDEPWIETSTGIAVVTVVCVFGVTLIVGAIIYTIHYCQKMRKTKDITKPTTARVEILEDPPAYTKERKTPTSPLKSGKTSPGYNNAFTREPGGDSNQLLNDKDYVVKNRQFDGRAVDQETGKMYEYNTKTNERQWMKTQKGKSVTADDSF